MKLMKTLAALLTTLVLQFFATVSFAQNFNPMSTNLFDRLGVTPNVSEYDLKQAYRHAARRFHPDLNSSDAQATIKFQKVKEAYEILSDPSQREAWQGFGTIGASAGTAFNEHTSRSDETDSADVRRRVLKSLASKNPDLADFISNVTDHHYGLSEARQIHFIPKFIPLLPSDRHLLDRLIATREPEILWAISQSVMEFSIWTDAGEIIHRIIDMKVPGVNEFIAQMVIFPNMINRTGASILSKLLDLGHVRSVIRSLNLGGHLHPGTHETWDHSQPGLEVLFKALKKVGDEQRRQLDNIVFDAGSPWIETLKQQVPAYKNEPHISSQTVLRLGIGGLALPPPRSFCEGLFETLQ